jgi:hypothetical protein
LDGEEEKEEEPEDDTLLETNNCLLSAPPLSEEGPSPLLPVLPKAPAKEGLGVVVKVADEAARAAKPDSLLEAPPVFVAILFQ